MAKKIRGMIVSVGGTPAPIIFSLNKAKPEYICFFVSKDTKGMIEREILPGLDFKPRHHDWIVTPNPELLSDCYSSINKKFSDLIEKWEIDPEDICVDYTGGTKTMSVALALATIDKSSCYSYVGGDERSKGGVGIVANGKERMYFLDNPWNEIALAERKEISILFNKARYASAVEVTERCLLLVSKEQRPFFKALREMITGYDLWDNFRHQEAQRHLFKSRDVLTALGSEKIEIKKISDSLDKNLQFLENLITGNKPSILYFYDLLANAKRRADLEKKYDDAVARLYRAIEVLGQTELKENFGIDTSDVKIESLPPTVRDEYLLKYREKHGEKQKIKIPLMASYRLLKELGSETAERFFESYEKEIRPIIDFRNHSILAHGFTSIDEKIFQRLFEVIMKFSQVKEEKFPLFPVLKI
jgi:CRISPR-associated protein (TIGR02710 family)